MSELKITSLHKSYGNVRAVKGVDLEVASGEFTVLVGPSGCGKSTLLRCIAGLEDVDGGRIEIGGKDVTWSRPRDRDIAMVFQSYALYPYMSVYDNIAFGLRARKVAQPKVDKQVKDAAEMLNIGALLNRRPRELSGGQRQRVAIGRAIVRDARLFLFDEPLSNLDAQLRDDMRAEMKRLHQSLKRTMVYVTHDQIEAMTLADRIILLRDGVIEQQGTPLELFETPRNRFVAGFLGSPRMNFVPAVMSGAALRIAGSVPLPLPKKWTGQGNRPVLLGIRPQHIVRAGGGGPSGRPSVTIVAEVVQITGTRALVTFALGGHSLVADLEADPGYAPGASVDVTFDLVRAIFIDTGTEQTLAPAG